MKEKSSLARKLRVIAKFDFKDKINYHVNMIVKAQTIKNGLIKPLKKINLPIGKEVILKIEFIKSSRKSEKSSVGKSGLEKIMSLELKGGPKDLSEKVDQVLYAN